MPYADLHVHSNQSDGVLSCAEIIKLVEEDESLQVVGISDHDTLAGARDGLKAATESNVTCIPAVELSTRYDSRNVHVLAYFIEAESKLLQNLFDSTRRKRADRTLAIAERMHEAGYPITADEVKATGKVVNRGLLARMLIDKGFVKSVDECFSTLIGQSSPYYVEAGYPDTIEAIHLIREADGYAFIAHPAHYKVVDLIEVFAHEGITGLEAYHSMQSAQESADLIQLAHDLGLAVSGGSDWHGDNTHGSYLGKAGLDKDEYTLFLRACERA